MKKLFPLTIVAIVLVLLMANVSLSSCYSFREKASLPDSIRTVRVNFIENRAPYINPQLSPTLTDRLKQKIISQTRLTNVNTGEAHLDISGNITDYSVSTAGVTATPGQRQQSSINRLTVTVQLSVVRSGGQPENVNVSRSFDFSSNQTLQQAEQALLDEMIRNLTDEIFNRIFSAW